MPLFFRNKMTADVDGGELAYEWRPIATWRLTGSYSYLRMKLTPTADSLDTRTKASVEGSSPRHTASLRSSLDLRRNFGLDVALRYVGPLPSQAVEAYTEMDVVVSRRLPLGFEVSLAGQNLLSRHHAEFGGGSAGPIEVERSVYGRIVRRW